MAVQLDLFENDPTQYHILQQTYEQALNDNTCSIIGIGVMELTTSPKTDYVPTPDLT